MRFTNRAEAGQLLAERLQQYARSPGAVVLALPRGGVPVAAEIAKRLQLPLDVVLVRKLGVPGHPELAMGAIAAGGVEVLNHPLIEELGVPPSLVQQVAVREQLELDRRDRVFRVDRPPLDVCGRTVIVVDDGLATGATMEAAIHALRRMQATEIVVAVPVGARETCERLARLADAVVCVTMPEPMNAVGLWYEDFTQTSDDEVRYFLDQFRNDGASKPVVTDGSAADIVRKRGITLTADSHQLPEREALAERIHMPDPIRIPIDGQVLDGDLTIPSDPRGVILFAHGSGSSRHSPRNKHVAQVLTQHGYATLLVDLLTPAEEEFDDRTSQLRFDIKMLADRLASIIRWIRNEPSLAQLPIGLFGASTGGGAALVAAAALPQDIGAVVSRGGRPDLAGPALPNVAAPTLLIVGERDPAVIELNRQAMKRMKGDVALDIIPGATHLFEEPGALAQVSSAAAVWFDSRLTTVAVPPAVLKP